MIITWKTLHNINRCVQHQACSEVWCMEIDKLSYMNKLRLLFTFFLIIFTGLKHQNHTTCIDFYPYLHIKYQPLIFPSSKLS